MFLASSRSGILYDVLDPLAVLETSALALIKAVVAEVLHIFEASVSVKFTKLGRGKISCSV